MPKITDYEITIDGHSILLPVKCGRRGKFTVNVPNQVVTILGCLPQLQADTLGQLNQLFMNLKNRWAEADTDVEKVIYLNADINDGDGRRDMSFSAGIGLCVEAAVAERRKRSGVVHYVLMESSIPEGFRPTRDWDIRDTKSYIPWTQDAEDRIAGICIRLISLTHAVRDSVGSGDAILGMLSRGSLLLEGGK